MTIRTLNHVWSPQLRNRRRIDVYLPPSYSAGRSRYPVVYMQDGQNLSDPELAFAGTWDLGGAIENLATRGVEAIVVGVHHAGEKRIAEYSPFPDRRHGGGEGDAYLDFLVDTVKPRIDRLFRSRTGRESTIILGSSMGGLISLYALLHRGSVFGGAGVMSAALWYGQGRIFDVVGAASEPAGRVYVDVGMHEGAGTLRNARRMARLLTRRGWRRRNGRLRYVEDAQGSHSEYDWARRLPDALEFLLRLPAD
jgi:predicted alpha/beta superfamily hydrolase